MSEDVGDTIGSDSGGKCYMKKIAFLSGTRADFGKIKSLISILQGIPSIDVHIFVTGMHLNPKYGNTIDEIISCGFGNIYPFINHGSAEGMDKTLASTIEGFSRFVTYQNPDLIIVHGDRVEALAGAIVGATNNILVAHIEGGELSGTIDELIRHAVSKLSHIHFVSNADAKTRLIQMGEVPNSIFVIGSPDLDIMSSDLLPSLSEAKRHYEIDFCAYGISMYHSVTTELASAKSDASQYFKALKKVKRNFIVIYPNNDPGSEYIIDEIESLRSKNNFRIFPSVRFEYFLTLLKNADFIVGNSSAGIREAPYYGVPVVNVGSRQSNRNLSDAILNTTNEMEEISRAIQAALSSYDGGIRGSNFGNGNSDKKFRDIILDDDLWKIGVQKQFQDVVNEKI